MITVYDFHANWCSPCQMMKPIFDKVAAELESDEIKFEKIDIDAHPELASKFEISSIPAFVVYRPDGTYGKTVGAIPPTKLKSFIDEYI